MTAYDPNFKPWIEQKNENDYLPNPEWGTFRYRSPTHVDRHFSRSAAHLSVKTDCCDRMIELIKDWRNVRIGPYYAVIKSKMMRPDGCDHNAFMPFLFCPFCGVKLEGADVKVITPALTFNDRKYTDQDWKDTLEEYRKREKEVSQLPEDTQKLRRLENKKWEDEQPAYRGTQRPHVLPFDYLKDAAHEMGKNPWRDV
jgi:hypothetical protein